MQQNLVTRGGELDREMERMRGLALKLSVQIERAGGLVGKVGEEEEEDVEVRGVEVADRLVGVVEEEEGGILRVNQ